jgi:probable HAF family extracellular repeat protein
LADGAFTQIDVPGATFTTSNGINNRGQIVGTFIDARDVAHGYLLDDGRFTTIDPPASTTTEAVGINGRGEIVGVFIDAGGVAHGFVAHDKKESRRWVENSSSDGRAR